MPSTPSDRERFLRRRVDDEEIWVDLEAGVFYGLNDTATRILALWRDGERSVEALVRRLAGEYDVPEDVLRPQVEELLAEARQLGLLGDDA